MPVRIGLGLGLTDQRVWRPFSFKEFGSQLKGWWNASNVTLNSTDVDTWIDLSGNGKTMTHTGTTRAAYTASNSNFNGWPTAAFASARRYTAGAASDWTFTHDGTGFHVFVVWRPTTATAGSILTTDGFGATKTVWCGWNNTTALRLQLWVGKTGNLVTSLIGNTDAVNSTVHLAEFRYRNRAGTTDAQLMRNRVSHGTEDTLATPDSGAGTQALHMGSLANNTVSLIGELAEVAIVSGELTADQVFRAQRYLAQKYRQLIAA